MDLHLLWFIIVGVLFTGYAMLDGFDLGVGALHLFHRGDEHRRLSVNSIGPVWDGNEVWLVTGGGALFAAFPDVYATVFSGFYLAFMLLLFALIFRAVAIEFRSKMRARWWRSGWDAAFSGGSVLSSFLIGVAMGNIARGIPIGPDKEFAGTFLGLLNPYALLMGVTTVALFSMHGSLYLTVKTEGAMQESARRLVRPCVVFFILTYAMTTVATLLYIPQITERIREEPFFFLPAGLSILAIANIPRETTRHREMRAFLSSCATMLLLMVLFGIGMFPHLVYSTPVADHSLTAYNASSSVGTLKIMTVIAAIGIPIVLTYTISIYWIFRGKVEITETSY